MCFVNKFVPKKKKKERENNRQTVSTIESGFCPIVCKNSTVSDKRPSKLQLTSSSYTEGHAINIFDELKSKNQSLL